MGNLFGSEPKQLWYFDFFTFVSYVSTTLKTYCLAMNQLLK